MQRLPPPVQPVNGILGVRSYGASLAATSPPRVPKGDALNGVLLPFCAAREVTEPAQLSNRLLNNLGAGLLDGTLSRRGRPLSKATVHSYMRAVNTFLEWAGAQAGETVGGKGKLPSMARQVLDVLSRDEVAAMEDAATTERDKLIVRLLFETGMRLGELLALRGRPADHRRTRGADGAPRQG